MAWYDFVQENRAEELQRASRKAIGKSPVTIDNAYRSTENFDEQGNPIFGEFQQQPTQVDPGYGLLADPNSQESWMNYATDIMGTVKGSDIGASMMKQLNAGAIAINKAEQDNNIQKRNIDSMIKDVWGNGNDQSASKPAMNPLANQVTQSVQGAQPNVPVTAPAGSQVTTSPQGNSTGSPQLNPVRTNPTASTQPVQNPEDTAIAEYQSKRRALENRLMWTGMKGGEGAKTAIQSQLKALDVQYGMGPNSANSIQEYQYAKKNDKFPGTFEDWKKITGATIMTDGGSQTPLTDADKTRWGLVDNNGQPVKTPYAWSKTGPKAVKVEAGSEGEKASAAYAGMMESLGPEIESLTPEDGWNKQFLIDEFADTLDWLPMKMANAIKSSTGQMRLASQDAWLNANGRDESGATIKDEEMDKYRSYYFLSPFDGEDTKEHKKKLRAQAIEGMKMKSGKAYGVVDDKIGTYKEISSGNNMIFTEYKDGYIYGITASGGQKRVKFGE